MHQHQARSKRPALGPSSEQMRRFTRLTNSFSKNLANLRATVAPRFAHSNLAVGIQPTALTPEPAVTKGQK